MTYIPYDPNVPEFVSDSLEESQPELLNNFLTLYDIFRRNHTPIDDPNVPGNHTNIQLKEQLGAIQTDGSEINLYQKKIESSTNQLFLRHQGNAAEIPYTCYQIYGLTPDNPNKGQRSYFTFLPGKILMYFGLFETLKDNELTLFPPIAKKIISVSCGLKTSSPSSSTFKARVSIPAVNPSGFFDKVLFLRSIGLKTPSDPQFYIVLANID